MRFLVLLSVLFALICAAMGELDDRRGPDYTAKYAELASPLPAHVNVEELISSLRAASNLH